MRRFVPRICAQILEADSKLELLREHIKGLQQGRPPISMRVRRESLVEDVLDIFRDINADTLLYPLKVQFVGENGVDAGGLTSELYTSFFTKLVEPERGE
jgi:hypothetical protein